MGDSREVSSEPEHSRRAKASPPPPPLPPPALQRTQVMETLPIGKGRELVALDEMPQAGDLGVTEWQLCVSPAAQPLLAALSADLLTTEPVS